MMFAPLLVAAVAAAPYQELREAALAEGRLVPGDTGVLVGLAGESGCLASFDPEDCETLREVPESTQPVVELVPVPALFLPALAGSPASLLLPRFPYGLGEPVTPLLGPLHIHDPRASWVRMPLPDGTRAATGQALASLLVEPAATGTRIEPFVEPPGPPLLTTLIQGVAADAWPPQLMPHTRVQVMLPMLPLAAQLHPDHGAPVELAWPTDPPALAGQAMLEPAWIQNAEQAMTQATGMCMRAYYADTLRRPGRTPPVLPSRITPPRLAVATDDLGQIVDAVPLDSPWDQAEPAACLRANARLLPSSTGGAAIAVLELSPPATPEPPSSEPRPSSR